MFIFACTARESAALPGAVLAHAEGSVALPEEAQLNEEQEVTEANGGLHPNQETTLTRSNSKITRFVKFTFSTSNSLKNSFFPRDLGVTNPFKTAKKQVSGN